MSQTRTFKGSSDEEVEDGRKKTGSFRRVCKLWSVVDPEAIMIISPLADGLLVL